MGPAKAQQRFFPHKGEQRQHRADHHTGTGGKRRRPDTPAKDEQKQKLQQRAQTGHQNVQKHAAPDKAADPQEIVHGKHDGGYRRTEGVNLHILHCQFRELSVRSHQADYQRCGEEKRRPDKDAGTHDHQDRAGKNIVCLLLLLLSEADGYGNRRSHTDQIRQRKIDNDKRHSQIDCGKSCGAQKMSYKNAVHGLVQRGGQHADCPRNCRQEKEFQRRCSGK